MLYKKGKMTMFHKERKYPVSSFCFCIFITILSLTVNACKSDNRDTTENKQKANVQIPVHEEKLSQYFSENNKGKWKDLSDGHTPTVNITKGTKSISIVVQPPFVSKPEHYIELIMLTDYALQEIDKISFKRGATTKKNSFTLPTKSKGEYYIIQKCNLHDMWYKKILIQ
ncbi:MAG: desulfoferrodoxin family protein [Leptospirales bacterium]